MASKGIVCPKLMDGKSEEIFEKRKVFTLETVNYQLPNPDTMFTEPLWQIDTFLLLKEFLNDVKSRMNHQDMVDWHEYTRRMSPVAAVQQTVKLNCNPEHLTRAWLKLYECVSFFDLVPRSVLEDTKKDLNTFHLCEAPGAFIASLNHFTKTKYPLKKWNWMATTLNPCHEGNDTMTMISEDTFLKSTLKNWTFLADNTGNIIDKTNIELLAVETSERLGEISLITADGGIDCQDDPGEQEMRMSSLNLAEIVTALRLLDDGGSFLLKMFTAFECQAMCHLYLLSCTFKQVTMFKPATSGEGNSEVYIICLGFKGSSFCREHLNALLCFIGNEDSGKNALFRQKHIPEAFIEIVYKASNFFMMRQADVIQKNLHFFKSKEIIYDSLRPQQIDCAELWIKLTEVAFLSDSDKIMSLEKESLFRNLVAGSQLRVNQKSYAQLSQEMKEKRVCKKLEYLYYNLVRCWRQGVFDGRLLSQINSLEEVNIGPKEKLYQNVMNSEFCFPGMMSIRRDIREFFGKQNHKYSIEDCNEEHKCSGRNKTLQETLKKAVTRNIVEGDDFSYQEICFHVSLVNLVQKTDMEMTVNALESIIQSLRTLELKKSLFLCRMSLLSRLEIGFMNFFSSIFEKTKLLVSQTDDTLGVLLFCYKGLNENSTCTLAKLESLLQDIKTNSYAPLTVVKMEKIENKILERILQYNTCSVYHHLNNMIMTALKKLQGCDEN